MARKKKAEQPPLPKPPTWGDIAAEIEALAQADPDYASNRLVALQRATQAVAEKLKQTDMEKKGSGS